MEGGLAERKTEYTAVSTENADNSTRSCEALMVLLDYPKWRLRGQALYAHISHLDIGMQPTPPTPAMKVV